MSGHFPARDVTLSVIIRNDVVSSVRPFLRALSIPARMLMPLRDASVLMDVFLSASFTTYG